MENLGSCACKRKKVATQALVPVQSGYSKKSNYFTDLKSGSGYSKKTDKEVEILEPEVEVIENKEVAGTDYGPVIAMTGFVFTLLLGAFREQKK